MQKLIFRLLFLMGVMTWSNAVAFDKPAPRLAGQAKQLRLRSAFATVVFEYLPGEGQFVNDPNFNDPLRALGPPIGGGTLDPDESKLVTLGNHGGSITLGFAVTVWDDPTNPWGLDAIVFGNAFYLGGNPNLRFGEAGVIEIAFDLNGNGVPDDPWYLIPGSDLPEPMEQQRNGFFLLPDDPYAFPPILNLHNDGREAFLGYGDMTPVLRLGDLDGDNVVDDFEMTAEVFYTVPDDPFEVGVSLGSGGGDAFDIAWAVDPLTNEPAGLRGFDFIRISTGADGDFGQFGEVSTEIGGVAVVGQRIRRVKARR